MTLKMKSLQFIATKVREEQLANRQFMLLLRTQEQQ
jgi:hypothetical protein